ncbi:MAG: hypothetical protein AAGN82_19510 [Myxococcota bacterium]
MRRLEHLETALPAGIIFDTAPPDQNPADEPGFPTAPGPGTPGPFFEVRVDWRTSFIDALGHDDFIVGYPPHFDTQHTDASYAQYVIGHAVPDCSDPHQPCLPCKALTPQASCVVVDQQGFLDVHGHAKLYNPVEGRTYQMWVYTNLHRGSPTTFNPTPMGASQPTLGSATDYVVDHDPNENVIGPRKFRLSFWVQTAGSILPNNVLVWTWVTAASHGAAIASLGLSRADLVHDRRWRFNVNLDCPGTRDNACFTGGEMYLGGLTTSLPGEAGNMQFKTILAHELGHGVDRYGSGRPINLQGGTAKTYARFREPDACNCDHFDETTDNQHHCLQSFETTDVARTEGFAHYFAIELFNDGNESDCAFYYYKQVSLWEGPPGSALREANRMTPADRVVDCSKPGTMLASSNIPFPRKYPNGWRDDGCWDRNHLTNDPFTTYGPGFDITQGTTQWDWLTFLWAIRHDSSHAISMQEHDDIVRDSCDGGSLLSCEFVWDGTNASGFTANSGFLPAAEAKFGSFSQKYFLLVQEGDDHGVDEGGQ